MQLNLWDILESTKAKDRLSARSTKLQSLRRIHSHLLLIPPERGLDVSRTWIRGQFLELASEVVAVPKRCGSAQCGSWCH